MNGQFLLHKDKEEKGKPTAQKQEFVSPFPHASLRLTNTCFFSPRNEKITIFDNYVYTTKSL